MRVKESLVLGWEEFEDNEKVFIFFRFMFLYIRFVQLLSFSVSLWDLLPFWSDALVLVCSLSQQISVHCNCSAGVKDVGLKKKKLPGRGWTTTIISCCI